MADHVGRLTGGNEHGNVVVSQPVRRKVIYLGSFENASPRTDIEVEWLSFSRTRDHVGVPFKARERAKDGGGWFVEDDELPFIRLSILKCGSVIL